MAVAVRAVRGEDGGEESSELGHVPLRTDIGCGVGCNWLSKELFIKVELDDVMNGRKPLLVCIISESGPVVSIFVVGCAGIAFESKSLLKKKRYAIFTIS